MKTETVASIAKLVGGRLLGGEPDHEITGVADPRQAGARELGFIRDAGFAHLAAGSRAGALLVYDEIDTDAIQIVVAEPHAAFAQVALHFHPVRRAAHQSIHPTAVVDPTAILEEPVEVGPGAVVGAGTRIGRGTCIQAGAVLGEGVSVGADCTIYPRVVVYDGVTMGDRCILHAGAVLGSDGFGYVTGKGSVRRKFPQLGTLVLGDDVEIGANSTLDRGALTANEIDDGVKIDNLCHVGHNCSIGAHSSVSALSAFSAETRIGARCTLAGNVRSGGGVRVSDDVILGGGAVLVKDVPEPGIYAGWPLQPRVRANRTRVLIGKLNEMATELRALRKKVREMGAPES